MASIGQQYRQPVIAAGVAVALMLTGIAVWNMGKPPSTPAPALTLATDTPHAPDSPPSPPTPEARRRTTFAEWTMRRDQPAWGLHKHEAGPPGGWVMEWLKVEAHYPTAAACEAARAAELSHWHQHIATADASAKLSVMADGYQQTLGPKHWTRARFFCAPVVGSDT
jgi:hypothetical protein